MRQEDYQFWVYILASRSRTLYIGMTNSLHKRILEHRAQTSGSFTAKYNITRLVYCEQFRYVNNAIAREMELKKWTRAQKIALIDTRQSNLGRPYARRARVSIPQSRFPSGMTKGERVTV